MKGVGQGTLPTLHSLYWRRRIDSAWRIIAVPRDHNPWGVPTIRLVNASRDTPVIVSQIDEPVHPGNQHHSTNDIANSHWQEIRQQARRCQVG
jgi:hypothetical protein